jgi:lipoprotein-releasing system permease protein
LFWDTPFDLKDKKYNQMKKAELYSAFFIARRYLFSKKKHNLVNIISLISMIGIGVSTAALVIVLSVFNGMEQLIITNFNSFNPDIKIELLEGKSFSTDSFPFQAVRELDGVLSVEEVVSDLALLHYEDKQILINLKGVEAQYIKNNALGNIIVAGDAILEENGYQHGIIGSGAASILQLYLNRAQSFQLYYPKRTKKNFANPSDAFNKRYLIPSGVFTSYTEYDEKYLFCDITFARELMEYAGEVTSIEVFTSPKVQVETCRKEIEHLLGGKFSVKDRYQQESLIYKTLKSEKLMIFMILTFILFIAAFNIIGNLGMLIVEKREDTGILYGLGASSKLIQTIFVLEGIFISFAGGIAGIFTGATICWVQETFHIVKLGNGELTSLVPYYPVAVEITDLLWVLSVVLVISLIASWLPAKMMKKNNYKNIKR